jgi:pimeloyl-ACP methyl ester carboxylesterase
MVVPPEGGVAGPPDDGLEGLRPIAERPLFGIMPNAPHQSAGVLTGAPYDLAFVEFDDQGLCYDREQMDAVTRRLDGMRMTRKDAIVLVFVHGWKHDARTDDDNLSSFRIVLAQTAAFEQAEAAKGGADARPVLGVFVGWRGLTAFGPSDLIADATFLGRQEAGHRVSTGSARELFGRLRHYRNSRLNNQGKPLLIIAGHSFGGMIVFSALAQSLIEAASDQDLVMDSRFADLVLLINPAIEGARYLPIYDLVYKSDFVQTSTPQLPLFICVQADNDRAVGWAFPLGNAANGVEEAAIGDLEQRCITHGLGFIDEFRTHRLDAPSANGTAVLDPPGLKQPSPFWVVRANPGVIDGHSGIWQASFKAFLASVVFSQLVLTRNHPPRQQAEPEVRG